MRKWINIQQKIVPEMFKQLHQRYRILQMIRSFQPVGRRALSQNVDLTERVLRKETDFLKEQGLLTISSSGMSLTHEGEQLLPQMDELIRESLGLTDVEQRLQETLSLTKVIVVPGDSQTSPVVKKDLGRAAVEQLKQLADQHSVVAVAGGTTMAAVAAQMRPHPLLETLCYVPARGGLGEDVENQANTICSQMADKSGGQYRLLHMPDQLSEEAYRTLLDDAQNREMIDLVRSARIVVHGIGEAITMAKRRKAKRELLQKLSERHAAAEAFGYYFNDLGQIVHKIQTIGLRMEDIEQANHILAVAGGKEKAEAILAFLKHGIHDVLITDEGAAHEILNIQS